MSKLNVKPKTINTVKAVAARTNHKVGVSANGNVQFVKKDAQALYEIVTSGLLGRHDGAAKSSNAQVVALTKAVKTLVSQGQLNFIANLAIHARTEMNIRTMPIVMVVQFVKALAENNTQYEHTRALVRDVIQRADQITDLYAYALDVFGNKNSIPMAIKRGVGDAMNKFGEYQFGKYNRDGVVKFRDILRIVHPSAETPEQGFIFKKIMEDTLETPFTWETQLSANGQLPPGQRLSNSEMWSRLLTSEQVGYMALLRNMRNIHEAKVPAAVLKTHLLDVISDPARVASSKQLPFDMLQAYNIVRPLDGKMATAVSKAIDASAANIPQIGEKIWLILDYSGSMGQSTDENSAYTSSLLLAASLIKANSDAQELAITIFGSEAMTLNGIDTNASVLEIARNLETYRRGRIAGSTNFEAAIDQYSRIGFKPDTIVVCTDGEVNHFPYHKLRSITNVDVKVTINMRMADTTPMIKDNGWYELSGWSPALFKWIPAMRNSGSIVEQLSVPYVPRVKRTKSAESYGDMVYVANAA